MIKTNTQRNLTRPSTIKETGLRTFIIYSIIKVIFSQAIEEAFRQTYGKPANSICVTHDSSSSSSVKWSVAVLTIRRQPIHYIFCLPSVSVNFYYSTFRLFNIVLDGSDFAARCELARHIDDASLSEFSAVLQQQHGDDLHLMVRGRRRRSTAGRRLFAAVFDGCTLTLSARPGQGAVEHRERWRLRWGWRRRNFGKIFRVRKLESRGLLYGVLWYNTDLWRTNKQTDTGVNRTTA